jgi:hypothetical protein
VQPVPVGGTRPPLPVALLLTLGLGGSLWLRRTRSRA